MRLSHFGIWLALLLPGLSLANHLDTNFAFCQSMLTAAGLGHAAATDLQTMHILQHGRRFSAKPSEIMHINELLPNIIDHALEYAALTPTQQHLLKRIRHTLGFEKRIDSLRFVSGNQNPQIFAHVGLDRVAATGDNVGDPIFINTDHIDSLDYSQIVALLIHEFGHHHNVKDDETRTLDQLGDAVAKSLLIQSHELADAGLANFKLTNFHIERSQTRATTREELFGMGILATHDTAYGTHLLLSDGINTQDLRELIRQKYNNNDQMIYLVITPEKFHVTNNTLKIAVTATFKVFSERKLKLEITVPLKNENGVMRFDSSAKDGLSVDARLDPDTEFLAWLYRRHFGFNPFDALATGEDTKFYSNERGELKITTHFTTAPGLRSDAMLETHWIFERDLDDAGDEVHRTYLSFDHPWGRVQKYSLEETSPGNYELNVQYRAFGSDTTHLKLAGFLIHTHGVPRIDRLFVVPEVIPTIKIPGPHDVLTTLQTTKNNPHKIKLPFKTDELRHFTVEARVPKDFPIKSNQDFYRFSRAGGGSVVAVLENPTFNYATWGPPFFAEHAFAFNLSSADQVTLEPGGRVRIPLRLQISEMLTNEQMSQYTRKPTEIKIKGFILQDRNLRSFYVPIKMTIELI